MQCMPPLPSIRAFIGLGSNPGDPPAQLAQAFDALAALPQTILVRRSSLYRSAPMGKTDQPDFCNAAALIETALSPRDLLAELLAIEHRHGRLRIQANGPRTLDLDLLLYGDERIAEAGLVVPHPRMHLRRFALQPLLELDANCVIPAQGRADACLARLPDTPDQRTERLK